jgi:patatin-like phospholipase/acyl hydrolase
MNAPKHPFKILAIDGGGIKGLYSSTILERFESKFNCLLSDKFDMICGTSTGGLIALAISLGIPCQEVSQLYQEKGALIFPPSSESSKRLKKVLRINKGKHLRKQLYSGGKYSADALEKALIELFDEKQIGESRNLLCIPTYMLTEGRNWVFKKDHSGLERDDQARYVDVALATTAAPTYLPVHEIEGYSNKQFIDGGIWANNPSLVGLIEAKKFFAGQDQDYDGIEILSISSLSHTQGKPTGEKKNKSFYDWGDDLFNVMLDGQAQFVEYYMQTFADTSGDELKYFRVPSSKISSAQEGSIDMDVTHEKALSLIKGKAEDMADIMVKEDRLKQFFNTDKTYNNGKLQ